ncbi:hypothetical protein HXX76_001815 [Chlamydomonas incerta]|uniref:Uncharacterized protein n=1 Tax=Chlamydomonas incerta TaxID=51695 RepID=A0A835W9M4_CHLIN|nr:hypothetical protein HXX76_001815 [Chlamydomonas incerta]|eukprot:KAG2443458.1 hypothetical protein HXX76_001815 [Chlamydomonas incerta]
MAPVASAVPKAISTAVFTNKLNALGSLAEETGVPVSVLVTADPQEVLSCIVDNRAKLVNEQRKRNEQDLIRAQLRRRLEQASFNVPGAGRAERMLDAQLKQEQQQLLVAELAAAGGAPQAAAAGGPGGSTAAGQGARDGAATAAPGPMSSAYAAAPLEPASSSAPAEPASASPFATPAAPASTTEAAASSPHLRPLQPRAAPPPPGASAAQPSMTNPALAPVLNSPGAVASPASYAGSVASSSHTAGACTGPQQPLGRLPLLLSRMSAATSSTAPGSPALPSNLARAAASADGGGGLGRGAPGVPAAAGSSPALAEPAPSVLRRSSSRSANSTLHDISSPSTPALPSPSATAPLVRRSVNGLPPARPSSSGVSAANGCAGGESLVAVSIGSMLAVTGPRTSGSGVGSSGNSPSVTSSAAVAGPSDAAGGADAGGGRPPSRLRDGSPFHPARPPPLALPQSQASLLQQLQQLPQPGEALPHHSCPGELVLPSPHSSAPSPASQAAARALAGPRRSYHNFPAGALLQGLPPGDSGSSPGGAVGAAGARVTVPPLRPSARSRAQSDCGVLAMPLQSQPSTPGAVAAADAAALEELQGPPASSATASSPKLPPLNQTSRRTLQLGVAGAAGNPSASAGPRQSQASPLKIWRV